MTAVTALSPSGTAGRPYGDTTKPLIVALRTYSETFTRLGPSATAARPYGDFTGKGASSGEFPSATLTVKPVVTMGQVTDIDFDCVAQIVPVARMSAYVTQERTASMVVRPVATQARSGTVISGTFPRASSQSVKPVATLSVRLGRAVPSAASVVPVATMASTVDATPEEKVVTAGVIPVAAMASTVVATQDSRTSAATVKPVASMIIQLAKVNAQIALNVVTVAQPRIAMSSTVRESGDVDLIRIKVRPIGHIRITKQ